MKTPEEKMAAARCYCYSLCARSEQCESELRDKMWKHGLTTPQISALVAELREEGFIDDTRFCRAFAHDKIEFSGWGLRKIRLTLLHKHLPAECIDAAFETIDRKRYEEVALNVARARARGRDIAGNATDSKRLWSLIIQRGFESSLATRVIHQLRAELQSPDNAD